MKLAVFALVLSLALANALSLSRPDSGNEKDDGPSYVITAPKIFTGLQESVCLVLLKTSAAANAQVKVQLKALLTKEVLQEVTEPLSGLSQCVSISTENVRANKAMLHVQVDDLVDDVREVLLRPAMALTIIETSKPVYLAQESVQIRVFSFDRWLKPVNEIFQKIWVENSRGLVVMEWTNVKSDAGILSFALPIAEDNLFGIWKIKALTSKQIINEKIFKVNAVGSPEIQIELEDKEYVLTTEQNPTRRVCVKNSLGFPISGKLRTTIGYQRLSNELPMDTNVIEINGCANVVINSTVLGLGSPLLSQSSLKFDFEFADAKTNFIQERSIDLPIANQPILIRFPSTKIAKTYFKANLPYFGQLLVEQPDSSPAAGQQIRICFEQRTLPWVAEGEATCTQFESDIEGRIHFALPPFNSTIKQVFIKAEPMDATEGAIGFPLQPWVSASRSNLAVMPLRSQATCGDKLTLDVLFNDAAAESVQNVYYQVIGRGLVESPKLAAVQLSQWKSTAQKFIGDQLLKASNTIRHGVIQIHLPISKAALTPMSRVLVFYKDQSGNIVAESSTFLVDCLDQGMKMQLSHSDQNNVKLQLDAPQDSMCAVDVSNSADRHRVTKRKMMKLLEKFDISQDWMLKDRCELQQLSNGQQNNAAQASHYNYREQALNPFASKIIDFHDSWDAFNDVGLSVSSNVELDQSPCEWDLFPAGVPREVLQGMDTARPYLWKRMSNSDNDLLALAKLEQSLLQDLQFWNAEMNPSQKNWRQFAQSRRSTDAALHGSAICFNAQHGLRVASAKLAPRERSFSLSSRLPTRAVVGEVIPINVFITKNIQKCIPLKFEVQSASAFDLIEDAQAQCICADNANIKLRIKPKTMGKIDLKVIVSRATMACEGQATGPFEAQESQNAIEIFLGGVSNQHIRSKILCGQNDVNEHSLGNLNGIKKITVSSNLISSALKQMKQSLSGERSALDVISALAPLSYIRESEGEQLGEQMQQQLDQEMNKAYQSLITYRLGDGSYSLFGGRKAIGDLSLTAEAYKVLSQAKKSLPFAHDGELRKSVYWIYSRQAQDGCFYVSDRNSTLWPITLKKPDQVTAFVVTALLEAGHPLTSTPVANALKCLDERQARSQSQSGLSSAMMAYIESLRDQKDQAQQYLQKFTRNEEASLPDQAFAYAILAEDKLQFAQANQDSVQRLLSSSDVWKSPINAQAIVQAWPRLRSQGGLRIRQQEGESLELNSYEPRVINARLGNKLNIEGRGCALLQMEKPTVSSAVQQTSFKITVQGLQKGYDTCHKRLMHICLREKDGVNAASPLIKMQLISGYQVDEQFLRKSLLTQRASLLNHFRVHKREVYLYLKALNRGHVKSQCIDIPLIQTHELKDLKPAFLQVYDYHQGHVADNELVDSITYTMPEHCTVVEESANLRKEKRVFGEVRVQRRSKRWTWNAKSNATEVETSCASEPATCPDSVDLTDAVQTKACDTYDIVAHVQFNKVEAKQCPTFAVQHMSKGSNFFADVESVRYAYSARCASDLALAGKQLIVLANRKDLVNGTLNLSSDVLLVKPGNLTCQEQDLAQASSYGAPQYAHAPAHHAPAYKAPAYEKPAYSAPAYEKPAYKAPAYEKPSYGAAPAYEKPAYSAPAYEKPAYEKPSYEAAKYEQPRYEQPRYEEPRYESAPKYEQARYEEPKYEQARYEEPKYEQPRYESAPKYEKPRYEEPKYEQAKYEQPRYEEPRYEAPKYEQGRYEQPRYEEPKYEQARYEQPRYEEPKYEQAKYEQPRYEEPRYEAAPRYEQARYEEPKYEQARYEEPKYEQSKYEQPRYEEPRHEHNKYEQPRHEHNKYEQPRYEHGRYDEPRREHGRYEQPRYENGRYEAPAYQAPAYQAPVYEMPTSGYAPPPVYEQPTYGYEQQGYGQAMYQAPKYEKPSYREREPSYQAPNYEKPAYHGQREAYRAPSYDKPAYQAPSYSAPAYEKPAYKAQAPAYEKPAYQAPAYEKPAYGAAPAYEKPAYEKPAYSAPAYEAPAPAYSAPAYEAPAYQAPAPAYEQPAYSAPTSYAAPAAYEAPKYEQPASYSQAQAPAYETPQAAYAPATTYEQNQGAPNTYGYQSDATHAQGYEAKSVSYQGVYNKVV